jgi:hypothetical protein
MKNLDELRVHAQRMMDAYPTHKSKIADLYMSAVTKVMQGEDAPNICSLMLTAMLELVGE